jgi:predicted double-glycine peptidase
VLAIPDVMQRRDYTCGPASLRAVLGFHGRKDVDEEELARRAGTNGATGTDPFALARAAEASGLVARVCLGMRVADLRRHVEEGTAVIVNYQAPPTSVPPAGSWATHWGDGHFGVVAGVDEETIAIADPWILGGPDRIPIREFVDRWHGGEDRDGHRFVRGGIVLWPARKP